MKITFIDDNLIYLLNNEKYLTGGASVQAFAWAKGFLQLGWEVEILTSYDENFKINKEFASLSVIKSYNRNKGVRIFRWIYYRIPSLYKVLRNSNSQYVYHGIPSYFSGIIAILLLFQKKKFILRVSNDILTDERIKDKYNLIERIFTNLGYLFAKIILVQNSYQHRMLKRKFPINKIYKIANPFSGKIIENSKKFIEREYISWIGIFQYQKNLPLLLEIVTKCSDIKFKIAGESYSHIDKKTNEALEKLKELKNVEFVGYLCREKIQNFLSEALCLLNTSFYEGFSNTYLEAFAVGTPVICPIQNDPDGIIQKEKLGYVYKDLKSAMNKINYIINDKDYNIISNNCINFIKENNDYKKLTKQILEILND